VVNGKQKGKRGELELCHVLKESFGWDAERSVQYNGNAGDSDLLVRQMPAMFLECKRVQSLSVSKAMETAVRQAGSKLPCLFHRRDREPWLLTIRLADLMELCRMVTQSSAMQVGRCAPTCPSDSTSSPPPEPGA
jgi:hypothetical protein